MSQMIKFASHRAFVVEVFVAQSWNVEFPFLSTTSARTKSSGFDGVSIFLGGG